MLSFISRDNVSGGARAPVLISHQRQLSLSVSQVSCQPIRGLDYNHWPITDQNVFWIFDAPGPGEADQEQDAFHCSGASHLQHQSPGEASANQSSWWLSVTNQRPWLLFFTWPIRGITNIYVFRFWLGFCSDGLSLTRRFCSSLTQSSTRLGWWTCRRRIQQSLRLWWSFREGVIRWVGIIILILGLIICLNPRLSLMSVCHAASVMQTKQVASCKTWQYCTQPIRAKCQKGLRTNPQPRWEQHAKHLDCWQKPDTVFQPVIIFMMKTGCQSLHGIKDIWIETSWYLHMTDNFLFLQCQKFS